MTQRPDRFVAEHAAFSFIPLRHDIPNQALLRIDFNLLQAVLAAVLTLRPAGAFLQAKRWFVHESSQRGFSSGDLHGFRSFGFRTRYQTFAAKPEICLHSRDRPKNKHSGCQHKDGYDDEHRYGHRAPRFPGPPGRAQTEPGHISVCTRG